MINSSKGKNVGAKQEGETNEIKLSRTTTTSSSRQWAGFKNPRIVRVSRTFGGKDRHSKVCTIRGLRDRRIRLSVPSAIQLYHLQDRLGLNQPSKVVDWLLDVTKNDIDQLPPLQIPPGDFMTQFYQQTLSHHNELNTTSFSPFFNSNSKLIKEGIRNDNNEDAHLMAIRKSNYLASLDSDSRGKHNEVERENIVYKWNSTNEQEYEGANSSGSYIPQLSAQNFLPSVDQFPFPSLINNNLSYNWEPPNLSLSQFGSQVLPSHVHSHSSTATHSSSLPSLAHQVPSFLPQYYAPYVPSSSSAENDHPRHVNHFQFMSSSSSNTVPDSGMSPFRFIHPFNMNSKENMQSSTGTDTTKL